MTGLRMKQSSPMKCLVVHLSFYPFLLSFRVLSGSLCNIRLWIIWFGMTQHCAASSQILSELGSWGVLLRTHDEYIPLCHQNYQNIVPTLLAGAAAFAAMTAYEHKRAAEGEPVSHAHAKQALAAIAGFEVGRKTSLGQAIQMVTCKPSQLFLPNDQSNLAHFRHVCLAQAVKQCYLLVKHHSWLQYCRSSGWDKGDGRVAKAWGQEACRYAQTTLVCWIALWHCVTCFAIRKLQHCLKYSSVCRNKSL